MRASFLEQKVVQVWNTESPLAHFYVFSFSPKVGLWAHFRGKNFGVINLKKENLYPNCDSFLLLDSVLNDKSVSSLVDQSKIYRCFVKVPNKFTKFG